MMDLGASLKEESAYQSTNHLCLAFRADGFPEFTVWGFRVYALGFREVSFVCFGSDFAGLFLLLGSWRPWNPDGYLGP